jgi:hypothetical protein
VLQGRRIITSIRFGSAKVIDFFDFQIFQRKIFRIFSLRFPKSGRFQLKRVAKVRWLFLPVQAIREINLGACGWPRWVRQTAFRGSSRPFNLVPERVLLAFPLVRLTFRDCKGRGSFWGGKGSFTK